MVSGHAAPERVAVALEPIIIVFAEIGRSAVLIIASVVVAVAQDRPRRQHKESGKVCQVRIGLRELRPQSPRHLPKIVLEDADTPLIPRRVGVDTRKERRLRRDWLAIKVLRENPIQLAVVGERRKRVLDICLIPGQITGEEWPEEDDLICQVLYCRST
jgi:hypothetical protein